MNGFGHKGMRLVWLALVLSACVAPAPTRGAFRVATFEADITIPIGHACMGGGVADAREIVDPLFGQGLRAARRGRAGGGRGAGLVPVQ